jgi:glutaredoxin-like protein
VSEVGAEAPQITVYWRPGCPFCSMLKRSLDRAGVVTTDVNIWEDPDAAAIVRGAARGNETVPTVEVGGRFLVNPSAGQVLAAAGLDDRRGGRRRRSS